MRLVNIVESGKFYLKIVLDDTNLSCNYIQKSKGCVPSKYSSDCSCLKCVKSVNWLKWSKDDTKASATCECGEKQTLEIIDSSKLARQLSGNGEY